MIEKTFTASDGLQLFERRWAPEGQPRAAVVIVHGYGHHCGSFAEVAARLTACGYAVFAFDQRGFGKSEGKRGYIASFDQTLADLDTYLAHITADVAGLPLFLMGHSYGGLVLGIYVATRQPAVQGLVFSSPLMKLSDDISPL
ncbi:MAG: alpha/beta fold hydrolase, partial [Candidatus Hydrogenedentes bacterium]|nr:alpha/beta fold hydrolase [Candidatus Hydrogenedentota bacterium]